jgi:hypothetical protein
MRKRVGNTKIIMSEAGGRKIGLERVKILYSSTYALTTITIHDTTAPYRPGPPHYRRFMITFRHTTIGKTPMGE